MPSGASGGPAIRRPYAEGARPVPVGLFTAPAAAVAAVSVAVSIAVLMAITWPGSLSITGDEPHYLVMADALLHDRTFDLREAYAREAQTNRIYGSPLPAPHVVIVNHRWGPYHEPGLAILLAMPFLIGGTVGSRLTLCLLAGLLPLVCFKWLRERLPTSCAAWLSIGLAVAIPISFGASQIYPDLPAGILATSLMLWLLDDERTSVTRWHWAFFWLATGLLPWFTLKFLGTTLSLAAAALVVLGIDDRRPERRMARSTFALVALGPATLAALHLWAFDSVLGPRGASELASPLGRAAEMFLGLHLDQAQGMFWQQPLALCGVIALVPFARQRPRIALMWALVYASLIVPNSLELARYGGGSPAGRFGWSAMWLWIVPIGYALQSGFSSWRKFVKPAVIACLVYQTLLAARWILNPGLLFPSLEEDLALRNSLFPLVLRKWLPSFYFWDFSSYWTYPPNVAWLAAIAVLAIVGGLYRARDAAV